MNRERDSTSFRISSPRRRSTAVSSGRRFSLSTSQSELKLALASPKVQRGNDGSANVSSFHPDESVMKTSRAFLLKKKQGLGNELDKDSWIPFAADTAFQTKPNRGVACGEKLGDTLLSSGSRSNSVRFQRSKRAHRRSGSSDDSSSQPSAQQTSSFSSCEKSTAPDAVSKRLHKSSSAITMSPTKSVPRRSPSTGSGSSVADDDFGGGKNIAPPSRGLMRCYSSSSSLEENPRERRRGRRPKVPTHRSRQTVNNSFNESIRLDFDNDEDGEKFGVFDNSFETAATASFRWGFGSSAVLEDSMPDLEAEFFEELRSPAIEQIPDKIRLYELAKTNRWDLVHQECLKNPWGAKHVGEEDGMTALHFAVMSRVNPYIRDDTTAANKRASLPTIEALVKACPESASVRCADKKYTPLGYACLVADAGYLMEDSAAIVRILLEAAPYCALVVSQEHYSCLDIHIISYSKIHKHKEEVVSSCGRSSVAVLRTLLELSPSLVATRDYGEKVRGPIELLYRCNLKDFKTASGEDVRKNSGGGAAGCTSKGSNLSDWWAWKWTQMMLRTLSTLDNKGESIDDASFSVLHAAAQMVGCPVPIICLAVEAYPEQAKLRGEANGKFNCPLHEVCSWVTDSTQIDGDVTLKRRKAKSILALLDAFPKAVRMTNNFGETPLQLAVETCTPWDGGLSELVKAFPKALMLPRSLEDLPDNSPLVNAMTYHDDDLGSVGFNENEWAEESIVAVDGMYPFQIAAVLSHVPPRRLQQQSCHQSRPVSPLQLQSRDLSSLTTIFGLLRARPEALAQFVKEEQERTKAKKVADAKEDTDDSSIASEATEEYQDHL